MSTTCCACEQEQETCPRCGELAEAMYTLGKAKAELDRLRELVVSSWQEGYQTACTHRGGTWEQSGAFKALGSGAQLEAVARDSELVRLRALVEEIRDMATVDGSDWNGCESHDEVERLTGRELLGESILDLIKKHEEGVCDG